MEPSNENVNEKMMQEKMLELQRKMLQLEATVVKTPWFIRMVLISIPYTIVIFAAGYALLGDHDHVENYYYRFGALLTIILSGASIPKLRKYSRIDSDAILKIKFVLGMFKKTLIICVVILVALIILTKIFDYDNFFLAIVRDTLLPGFGVSFIGYLVIFPVLRSEYKKVLKLKEKMDAVKSI